MSWYSTLELSPLNPPSYVFGPVWTVLYAMIAYSLYVYTQNRPTTLGLVAFTIHMLSNFAWFPLFFILYNPKAALGVIILMIITLLWVLYEFRKRSKFAFMLLIPYFLWVSFASYLNAYIVVKNPDKN
jgi:tryptophan-rich sensory protein